MENQLPALRGLNVHGVEPELNSCKLNFVKILTFSSFYNLRTYSLDFAVIYTNKSHNNYIKKIYKYI